MNQINNIILKYIKDTDIKKLNKLLTAICSKMDILIKLFKQINKD
jgi:hypothetical protein